MASRCILLLGLLLLLLVAEKGGVQAGSKITAADLANLNLYKVLGVTAKSTSAEIAKAYRKLAIKYHPDKNPKGQDQFIKIAYAYEILGDETKRARYDAGGFAAATEFAAQAPNWDTWTPPEPPTATVFEEWQNHNIYYDLAILVALLAGGAGAWVVAVQASERLKKARKAARKAAAAGGGGASRPRRQRVRSSGALLNGSGGAAGGGGGGGEGGEEDSCSDSEEGGAAAAAAAAAPAPSSSGSLLQQQSAKPAAGGAATAAAMREWSAEELRLLDKGLKKFPVGTVKRWEAVTGVVRTRTLEEVLVMVKTYKGGSHLRARVQEDWKAGRKGGAAGAADSAGTGVGACVAAAAVAPDVRYDGPPVAADAAAAQQAAAAGGGAGSSKAGGGGKAGAGADKAGSAADTPWTEAQEVALVAALKACPKELGTERWDAVAKLVPGRTKAQCFKRFKELREAFRSSKKAAGGGGGGADGGGGGGGEGGDGDYE
ncbi:hypothetical protein HYH02_014043 [Chlamydomonas schloesseri]|uniref:DnaJ homolog subfamily C member 2 n=1 Tax=Chlamydomonas schloesseri TaxID=2026947 RepID=A0A835VXG3_9CHLO|nr:hypothetical protein HYH02_014043 [Chlamydomonas schloesseri]|eukprot:KAG2429463.1 hypothetical protein HYH02_014043 [Chlamydomonas schloesseri]